MHITDILNQNRPSFSFEFFPPKTEAAADDLFLTIAKLQELHPAYVSVTYGAGGSTRERTHDLIVRIQKETNLTAVSHLTSVCHTLPELEAIVDRYMASGIENILALRGDAPRNVAGYDRSQDAFQYAEQLVRFLRERSTRNGQRGFGIGVAGFPEGHPEMPNRLKEMEYLKRKVDAGADYICTQLFFDNRDFYDFRERCELAGIDVPIIAGIMPIGSRSGLARMAELALGSRFPAKLLRAISRTEDDEATTRVGIHWATEQCRDLLDHQVRGIHFYTLNKSDATRQVFQNLGVSSSRSFQEKSVNS
ncbi:MAG: 5,10-methylenetetrahydrofolate reductase [Planctomycetota bacterium]|jgi:methylenetetrahydrofolate reductase (NADPH)